MTQQVETIYGLMDIGLLEGKSGINTSDDYDQHWVEYWLKGELVHRSVHLYMKQGIDAQSVVANLG